ncbi:MAG TPA: sugar ABC transporter permease [Candidatus Hydrogenedentes bacterium]|nr:sugar ABC transporter permease [Candidatus Hydrogenedentota bacterium]
MTRTDRRNLRNGLLFASPYIFGFLIFTLYPFAASVYYSFCNFNAIEPPIWTGLDNYRQMINDSTLRTSLFNTLYYTVGSVPLGIAFAILLAVMLNQKLKGMSVYRTIFFLPTIVPLVASAVLWLWVLNPENGLLNGMLRVSGIDSLLGAVGIPLPNWLADQHWAMPSLILMSFWGVGGAVVIFLAGLAEVPQSLYEVADIDGAGPLRKFWNVTLPMITPTILFNLVMGLIGAFQYFTQVYVMTGGTGGPANKTLVYALYLYQMAFKYLNMGYASAMGWMLFVFVLALTLGVMYTSKRWVHYHGD